MKRLILWGICLLVIVGGGGGASWFYLTRPSVEKVMQHFEAKEYRQALEIALPIAERDDPQAQYIAGLLLYSGHDGVERNKETGLEWLRKAADNGYMEAQFKVGEIYAPLLGAFSETPPTQDDYAQAAKWYLLAAEQGHKEAQSRLAGFYAVTNRGVDQDFTQAFKWYKAASEQGDDLSRFRVAEMYRDGRGIAQDTAQAFNIFSELATKKAKGVAYENALYALAQAYEKGQGVAQDYEEAIKLYKEVIEKEKANSLALRGNTAAALESLGRFYADGRGVAQDFAKAEEFYNQGKISIWPKLKIKEHY